MKPSSAAHPLTANPTANPPAALTGMLTGALARIRRARSMRRRVAAPCALLAAIVLAACGGGGGDDAHPASARPASPRADAAVGDPGATPRVASARPARGEQRHPFEGDPVPPLLDDHGAAMPSDPRIVPADPGARTRSGRYATPAQAQTLERTLGGRVVWLEVRCCGAEEVDTAVGLAHGLQAAQDLPDDAPLFVRGADARLVATVANRLGEAGYGRVWVVPR
jgi:hypothetical protein